MGRISRQKKTAEAGAVRLFDFQASALRQALFLFGQGQTKYPIHIASLVCDLLISFATVCMISTLMAECVTRL